MIYSLYNIFKRYIDRTKTNSNNKKSFETQVNTKY